MPNGENQFAASGIDKRGPIEAEDKSVSETVYAIKNPRIRRGGKKTKQNKTKRRDIDL